MIEGQRKRGEKTTTNGGKESNIRQAQRGRGGRRGRRAAEGGEVNVFRRAMGRRDNKRKKRQRMRAAAAAAAAAARLCNINLRRADQKAGELSCVPAESERWREFSPLGLPALTLDSPRAHSLRLPLHGEHSHDGCRM